jgi:hypothetical protein
LSRRDKSVARTLEHKYNEGAYDELKPIARQMDSAYCAAAIQLRERYGLAA